MPTFADVLFETRNAASSLVEYVTGAGLRLGVTGLSRAGKTVFITALVHNLVRASAAARDGERVLPVFRVHADGRLIRARLQPQPDDNVPRFAYEDHLAALTGDDRHWPESTRRISELRLTIEFERAAGWLKGPSELTIDIVDYPGEWLLDLPLLSKSYAQWSRDTLVASASAARAPLAAGWRGATLAARPGEPGSEEQARKLADLFTAYLRAARAETYALSTLPPGRFLMPGDLEGSPALTFAPLRVDDGAAPEGSLHATMERRYESYKTLVVRPFFRDHFARLDRQIVLVDALSSLNSGPAAVRDLETALAEILTAFRAGRSNVLSTIFRPKIDRILFAATKADHLHHQSHDRLEAILRLLTARAIARAEGVGARVDVVAMAAVRATREATVKQGRLFGERADLDAIVGTPLPGERIDGETFDGTGEVAIYPGALPADPKAVFRGDGLGVPEGAADYRFVRFRPPAPKLASDGAPLPAPSIRLDRALEFLLGRPTPMSGDERQRPRAFRLDDDKVLVSDADAPAAAEFRKAGGAVVAPAPDAFAPQDEPAEPASDEQAIEIAQKRGLLQNALLSWGGLFWSALTGLVSLGFGLWTTRIVDDLFARSATLGWIGVALAAILLFALLGLLARETRAIFRQRRIAHLHIALAQAREADDRDAARKSVAELVAIYGERPETARARSLVTDLTREIVDGRDLVDIAERNLMAPLDVDASREIAAAAKRVSMVTAISPRAIVDVLFVGAQAVRLLRRISEIYGGRPGFLGFIRLARSVGAHLAITGGMALGDSLVQQVVGHGIAARLSARLGEGVLNGMLTTRIGLSAMAVCRPMPFAAEKQPGVKDVAPFLFGGDKN